MKILSLLRHAKSDWSSPDTRDFDRPINTRGSKGATIMGEYFREHDIRFDHVLASPAKRVTETIDLCQTSYGRALNAQWDRRVYLASSATLIDLLRETDDAHESVLLVGHNPGLEDLILDLVPEGSSPLREEVEVKFPTAAYARMEFDGPGWGDLEERCARLTALVRPRDLDPDLGPQADD